MPYISLIYMGVNRRCMNGRNMVHPQRDRVEKWAVDGVRIEASLVKLQKASKSLLPPSGTPYNGGCVCLRH